MCKENVLTWCVCEPWQQFAHEEGGADDFIDGEVVEHVQGLDAQRRAVLGFVLVILQNLGGRGG